MITLTKKRTKVKFMDFKKLNPRTKISKCYFKNNFLYQAQFGVKRVRQYLGL